MNMSQSSKENICNKTIENVEDIISLITTIDKTALDDGLIVYHETKKLIETIETISIAADSEIQSLAYYCVKTGQPLEDNTINFAKLQEVVGKDLALEIFKRKSIEQVAPHWLSTTGKALDNLSNIDPYGYFVYATFLIARNPKLSEYFTHSKQGRYDNKIELRYIELKAKIKFWCKVQSLSIENVIETNEVMRRYLAIISNSTLPETLQVTYTDLDWIDITLWKKILNDNLTYIIIKAFQENKLKKNISYADVVNLQLIFKGHSNFNAQKKLRSMTQTENVALMLKDFVSGIPDHALQPSAPFLARKLPRTKIKKFKTGVKLAIKIPTRIKPTKTWAELLKVKE